MTFTGGIMGVDCIEFFKKMNIYPFSRKILLSLLNTLMNASGFYI